MPSVEISLSSASENLWELSASLGSLAAFLDMASCSSDDVWDAVQGGLE
jgi:hypothetical protein